MCLFAMIRSASDMLDSSDCPSSRMEAIRSMPIFSDERGWENKQLVQKDKMRIKIYRLEVMRHVPDQMLQLAGSVLLLQAVVLALDPL